MEGNLGYGHGWPDQEKGERCEADGASEAQASLDPARTSVVGRYKLTEELPDRTLEFEQTVDFRSDPDSFYLSFHRWVRVDGELLAERNWDETIPRDFQ